MRSARSSSNDSRCRDLRRRPRDRTAHAPSGSDRGHLGNHVLTDAFWQRDCGNDAARRAALLRFAGCAHVLVVPARRRARPTELGMTRGRRGRLGARRTELRGRGVLVSMPVRPVAPRKSHQSGLGDARGFLRCTGGEGEIFPGIDGVNCSESRVKISMVGACVPAVPRQYPPRRVLALQGKACLWPLRRTPPRLSLRRPR